MPNPANDGRALNGGPNLEIVRQNLNKDIAIGICSIAELAIIVASPRPNCPPEIAMISSVKPTLCESI